MQYAKYNRQYTALIQYMQTVTEYAIEHIIPNVHDTWDIQRDPN